MQGWTWKTKGWDLAEKIQRSLTEVCLRRVYWQLLLKNQNYLTEAQFELKPWAGIPVFAMLRSIKWVDLRNEFCKNNAIDVKEKSQLCHWLWFWFISFMDPPRVWSAAGADTSSRSYWTTHGSSPLTLFLKNVRFVQLSLRDKDRGGIHLFCSVFHSKMCGVIVCSSFP